jgi:adenosylcobinamide-phosphate synthase
VTHRPPVPAGRRPATAAGYRDANWPLAAGLAAGVTADAIAGDPARGHPVALFGTAMTALEQRLYADRRPAGAALAAAGTMLAAAPAVAAGLLTRRHAMPRLVLTAAVTWAVTGARSLATEAERVRRALASDDLAGARGLLPRLCGRDPQHLDAAGIARAVVESVAENTSDAVVAPLLWGALAGPPGMAGYRAINTLDAMVGHHSPRYERFGWASARLDDVANWMPARVTAALTAVCAPLAGGRPDRTWRIARSYGPRHPSPNAGWCEAAFAGALGIRLGGPLSYGGRAEYRPELGTGRRPEHPDISRAIRLSRAVTAAVTTLPLPQRQPAAELPGTPPDGRLRRTAGHSPARSTAAGGQSMTTRSLCLRT